MASSGKRKTTMAKLNREQRLRERKMEKQHRKDTRKDEEPDVVEEVEDLSHLDRYVDPFSAAELAADRRP
jgi:ribosome-binding protein aMBF1 (putative translation factor)